MHDLSTMQLLGLPSEYGVTLLILCTILAVAPFLDESDYGILKIPAFKPELKRRLKFIGPTTLLFAVLLHLPFWSKDAQEQTGEPAVTTPQGSTRARPSPQHEAKPHPSPEPTGSPKETRPEEHRPRLDTPSVRSAYKIHLLVPTSLSAPSVRVNGAIAPIIRRTANVITIEAPSGLHSYQIEAVGSDGKICNINVAITEDGVTFPLCEN